MQRNQLPAVFILGSSQKHIPTPMLPTELSPAVFYSADCPCPAPISAFPPPH